MSLRIKRSLVWESRHVTKQKYHSSPRFSLMSSNWMLKMVFDREKSSCEILLRKCNGGEAFEPFDVTTFIEDRRNNVQIKCSILTVSSICEILYKDSIDRMYEKVPGIALYDDMSIVCTFCPSTGLEYNKTAENASSLRIRESLVWVTRKPTTFHGSVSPVFEFMQSYWRLEIYSEQERDVVCTRNCFTTYKILLKNYSHIQLLQSFDVSTFIEDPRNSVQMECSRLTVASFSKTLYQESNDILYQNLPGLKLSDDITIVCIFCPTAGLILRAKKGNDLIPAIEAYTQSPKNDCLLQDCVVRAASLNQSTSLASLPDFESLSDDLSYLLKETLLSDVQLKCGEYFFPAHKAILAGRSKVFSLMLQQDMVESRSGIVHIKDIKPLVLHRFLTYLYSGKIPHFLTEDMVCDLYTVSDKYAVSALQKLCSNYMAEILNIGNAINFLILADMHSDRNLKDAAANFITECSGLLGSDPWINFSREFPSLANEIYQMHMAKMPLKQEFNLYVLDSAFFNREQSMINM